MTFKDLNLIAPIAKALEIQKYTQPTPIQERAIPEILKGNDVLACAQTGTGKTAAFSIPVIQLLNKNNTNNKNIRCLILTPTRELAIQIHENIKSYSAYTSLTNTVIFGGVKQAKQVASIRQGANILIATPGRLLDLINQKIISLNNVETFVLDEADRMLDMGFINDIKKLLKILPAKRQNLFFSATMPQNIVTLSNTILSKPVKIEVNPVSSTAETIEQHVYMTNKSSKRELLVHILKNEDIEQVLLFSRTKHGANKIAKYLSSKGITATPIHGDRSQNQRQKALQDFKNHKIRVLVATDIAARGIDIDKLKYVINFDIPHEPETYVHRIGRSGRANENGIAIAICEPEENEDLKAIEKLINQKVTIIKDNPFPQTDKPMTKEEKKQANKEKVKRRQEFFANRKKNNPRR